MTKSRNLEGVWLVWLLCAVIQSLFAASAAQYLHAGARDGLQIFGSFYGSGSAVLHGLNPYAVYPLTHINPSCNGFGKVVDLNLNPPPVLPLFARLARFRPTTAAQIWTFVSLAFFLGGSALLVAEYRDRIQHRQVIWLLCTMSVTYNLRFGQVYSLLFVLGVASWIFLERKRALAAGICLGLLIAFKPNFAVWPCFLFLRGDRWIALTAAAVASGLATLAAILYTPHVYSQWLVAVAGDPHWMASGETSLTGLATRLGHPLAGRAASALLLLGSGWFIATKRPSLREASGIAVTAGILASPLAWIDYTLVSSGLLVQERWGWFLSLVLLPMVIPRFMEITNLGTVVVVCLAIHFFQCALKERRTVMTANAAAGASESPVTPTAQLQTPQES